ncbi:MAG: hypothetical protein ACXWCZ_11020 [Flavisolibacter sp.]
MKKNPFILVFLSLSMIFNSCLDTLYPFFTKNDVVFKSTLTGEWKYASNREKGSVYFESIPKKRLEELAPGIREISNKGYLATWKDSTGKIIKNQFVFLTLIGDDLYMDHYPAEMENAIPIAQVFTEHYVKKHMCYKLSMRSGDVFEMKRLERSFLDDLIEKKQIRIHYVELPSPENKRIITASTAELRQYLLKYGANPKAYNDDYSYTCTRVINY